MSGSEWLIAARCRGAVARTILDAPLTDFDARVRARKVDGDDEAWYGLVAAVTEGTKRVHHRFLVSGLATYAYEVAEYDANESAQTNLEVVQPAAPAALVQPGNGDNMLRLVRRGGQIEFWVNEQRVLREASAMTEDEAVDLGLVVTVQNGGSGQGALATAFRDFAVFAPR
jgi:hypothetical protein